MIKSVIYTTLIFLFSLINTLSQSKVDYYSTENRLAFGDHLFNEKDYLRAIDEYLAYLESSFSDTVTFKIAYSYEQLDRFDNAIDYYRSLFFNTPIADNARLRFYKSSYNVLNNEEFVQLVDDGRFITDDISQPIYSLRNVSLMFGRTFVEDSSEFLKPFDIRYREDLKNFYKQKMNPDHKDPLTAALLSTLLPGLGKVYTENYTDALTSLLVTGIFGYLAYDNFSADHDFRGWLFSGLAAYFYAGNIYGSYASAGIYNAGIRISFENDLKMFVKKNNYFLPKMSFVGER